MLRALLLFFAASLAISSHGQDIHFSQYNASPLNLNPALTGHFDGDYRLVGNYRNQWNSITTPYTTYSFSADARRMLADGLISAGITAFSDEAGDSEFGTVQISFSAGISYPLTYDSSHVISFGIQPGIAQRNMNAASLTFDNQYSAQQGRFDPSLSSRENFANDSRTYFNAAAGLSWDYRIDRTKKITTGLALHNLPRPKQTYFRNELVRLERRFTFHTNAQLRVAELIDVLPGISWMAQGKYREFVVGSSARYLLNGLTNLHLGYWYRNQDAGFITAGITHQNVYMGMSYDFNTSDLKAASNGRGGFELSLIYIIRKFDRRIEKYKACPDYL